MAITYVGLADDDLLLWPFVCLSIYILLLYSHKCKCRNLNNKLIYIHIQANRIINLVS